MPRWRNALREAEEAGMRLMGQGNSVQYRMCCSVQPLLSCCSQEVWEKQNCAINWRSHSCLEVCSCPPRWARAGEWENKGGQVAHSTLLCKNSWKEQYHRIGPQKSSGFYKLLPGGRDTRGASSRREEFALWWPYWLMTFRDRKEEIAWAGKP